jgi:hypothetical protein
MDIYRITFGNYHEWSGEEYYHSKKNAFARLRELYEEGKTKDEFEEEGIESFSWFDAEYNEYSTTIDYDECTLNDIFSD